MAKNLKRTILSDKMPNNKHIIWAQPNNENIDLKIFDNKKWKPVGSNSNYNTNQNVITLTSETSYNDLKTLFDTAVIEKGLNKTNEELNSMSNSEYKAYIKEYMQALKDTTFVSDGHGKSVNVLFDDTQNPPRINILYEDGCVVSYRDGYDTKEIPPTMRYCYGKENMNVWLWDEFGERNIGENNAHTLTTVLYEPDTGRVYNLVYINPNPESQIYQIYSKWVTHYEYPSDNTTEDRVNYIILSRHPQLG